MGLYEVTVEHSFTAVHAIRLADGSLEPAHEHRWKVLATFRSATLQEPQGIVVDFLEVRAVLEAIAGELEGRELHRLPELEGGGASAERVAHLLAERIARRSAFGPKLCRVGVTEAPGCEAVYRVGAPRP